MKDKFTFKVFIIGLVALAVGMVSFMLFDVNNIRDLKEKDALWENRREYEDLNRSSDKGNSKGQVDVRDVKIDNDVKKLDVELVNGNIEIIEGDSFEYTVTSNREDVKMSERLDIQMDKDTLNIIERERRGELLKNLKVNIYITVPKDKKLDLAIEMVNGKILGQVDFNKIAIEMVNGDIRLKGKDICETDIEGVNLDVELTYNNYDSIFDITGVSGKVRLFDEKININPMTSDSFERKLGNGTYPVNIEMVNGNIEIKN